MEINAILLQNILRSSVSAHVSHSFYIAYRVLQIHGQSDKKHSNMEVAKQF